MVGLIRKEKTTGIVFLIIVPSCSSEPSFFLLMTSLYLFIWHHFNFVFVHNCLFCNFYLFVCIVCFFKYKISVNDSDTNERHSYKERIDLVAAFQITPQNRRVKLYWNMHATKFV